MKAKIGLKDVALDDGVSLSTASHVLNGTAPISIGVRNRVPGSAQWLGYLEKRRSRATIATLRTVLLAIISDAAPHSDLNLRKLDDDQRLAPRMRAAQHPHRSLRQHGYPDHLDILIHNYCCWALRA
ncbi:hypothetical protein J2046_003791 [Rhizobium petrolearium]|nr:hypothetical protein [Neorhizobium petrolearium]